jgi:hypothetical protein
MLEEPDLFGGAALFKEEDVGGDAGVGTEDALGQSHNGVEVELFEQFALERGLDAFTKEEAVRQHHGGTSGVML